MTGSPLSVVTWVKTLKANRHTDRSDAKGTCQIIRCVAILWPGLLLALMVVSGGKTAAITVIVPIDEVKFESPVLPPPLWRTNFLVMKELAFTQVKTFGEKESETIQTLQGMPTIAGAVLSYERVKGDFGSVASSEGELRERREHDIEYDGSIVSTYVKTMWEIDRLSFGALIPYDYFDLDSFDANRIGVMLFGKYHLPLTKIFNLGFILNGNYLYNQVNSNISNVKFSNFNTFGGNASISIEMDTQSIYRGITVTKPKLSLISFAGSLAFSYQFNKDDVDRMGVEKRSVVEEVDAQNLFMLGFNFGIRIREKIALTLHSIWNYDATDYKGSLRGADDHYFDIALELAWTLSPRWRISGGYKKLVGYKDLDSDQIFIGTFLRF